MEWVQHIYDQVMAFPKRQESAALTADEDRELTTKADEALKLSGVHLFPEGRIKFANAFRVLQNDGLRLLRQLHQTIKDTDLVIEQIKNEAPENWSPSLDKRIREYCFAFGPGYARARANDFLATVKHTKPIFKAPQGGVFASPEIAEKVFNHLPPEELERAQAEGRPVIVTADFVRSIGIDWDDAVQKNAAHLREQAHRPENKSATRREKPKRERPVRVHAPQTTPTVLSPEQIRVQTIQGLLELQREAVEAQTSFVLRINMAKNMHAELCELIEYQPLYHEEAQEKFDTVIALLAVAKDEQEELLASLEQQNIQPVVRTAESLVVQSVLADDVGNTIGVHLPAPVALRNVTTKDLAEHEATNDPRIQEIVQDIKKAREAANAAEQEALKREEENKALQKYLTEFQHATRKIGKATEAAERLLIQYGIDNARLNAQMTAAVTAEQPEPANS